MVTNLHGNYGAKCAVRFMSLSRQLWTVPGESHDDGFHSLQVIVLFEVSIYSFDSGQPMNPQSLFLDACGLGS